MLKKITGDRIRQAREAAGITQQQAADLVHVARRTWQDWELEKTTMPGAAWELFCIKRAMTYAITGEEVAA